MTAIITFTGFRQSSAARSGFEDGYFRYVSKYAGDDVVTYAPREWTTDVKELGNQLARQGIDRVILISYSHGQAAATAFARYAYDIGIYVDLWLACDPVYRPTWLPRWNWIQPLAFRALRKTGKIDVPSKINRTVYIRQEKDKPRGHTLVPTGRYQAVSLAGVYHSYGHAEIDDSPEWWNLVNEELTAWLSPPKAIKV